MGSADRATRGHEGTRRRRRDDDPCRRRERPAGPFGRVCPPASRRRGLAEDSTGPPAVARRFAHTPREYRRARPRPRTGRLARVHLAGTWHGPSREGRRTFDTPVRARPIIPPDERRAVALSGARRVCVPYGVGASGPRAGWRGSRTVPMGKPTYQPKKRHRAKEHGFRARMKSSGGRRVLADAAGQGPEAPDGLTGSRGHNPPRLVDALPPGGLRPAARREASRGRTRSSSDGSSGPTSRPTRFGFATGRASVAPSSGTGSGDGSARRSG